MSDKGGIDSRRNSLPDDLLRRIEEIAEQYLERLQAGENPDRGAVLEAHPDIADLLEARLILAEALHSSRLDGMPPRLFGEEEPGPTDQADPGDSA